MRPGYSTFAPDSLTARPSRGISAAMNAVNSAGLSLASGTIPWSDIFLDTSGDPTRPERLAWRAKQFEVFKAKNPALQLEATWPSAKRMGSSC